MRDITITHHVRYTRSHMMLKHCHYFDQTLRHSDQRELSFFDPQICVSIAVIPWRFTTNRGDLISVAQFVCTENEDYFNIKPTWGVRFLPLFEWSYVLQQSRGIKLFPFEYISYTDQIRRNTSPSSMLLVSHTFRTCVDCSASEEFCKYVLPKPLANNWGVSSSKIKTQNLTLRLSSKVKLADYIEHVGSAIH